MSVPELHSSGSALERDFHSTSGLPVYDTPKGALFASLFSTRLPAPPVPRVPELPRSGTTGVFARVLRAYWIPAEQLWTRVGLQTLDTYPPCRDVPRCAVGMIPPPSAAARPLRGSPFGSHALECRARAPSKPRREPAIEGPGAPALEQERHRKRERQ
jgi:hypothetical protein